MAAVAPTEEEDVQKYFATKKVDAMLEGLLHGLLVAAPADPLAYLARQLERRPFRPKLIISGVPGAGSSTISQIVAERYALTRIRASDVSVGEAAPRNDAANQKVTDAVLISRIAARIHEVAEGDGGWVLDGAPSCRAQAICLQAAGCFPDALILLDVPHHVARERACQLQHSSEMELLERRLKRFASAAKELEACYPTALTRVDASQPLEVVIATVCSIVDRLL